MSRHIMLVPMLLIATLLIGLQQNAQAVQTMAQGTQEIPILTVNINTATADELADVLTGVGKSKAELIVAYRDTNGKFKQADDLLKVKGIGAATLDKNRDRIKL